MTAYIGRANRLHDCGPICSGSVAKASVYTISPGGMQARHAPVNGIPKNCLKSVLIGIEGRERSSIAVQTLASFFAPSQVAN
ncbi:MAG: hypothetical protein ACJ74Z_20305 [Bryobacteraceae bacterium]